ncbi:MAG TPA: N-methyl-L-tryptophan oxidase [Solirubrobacteraceae bacterium]|jgi:sarcosine oxidase|nr:N-methyl-L-tryptophan oxidase [Solirubrobacteraceae bacterium]
MSDRFDAIVVGVGGMGSAALHQLARRGLRVLGLDRFAVPNERGSSHGITRVIRLAYNEDPAYVPLARRAYEGWRELETEAGEQLLYITGSMDISRPDQMVVEGSIRSCEEHDLPYEVLDAREVARRFPAYRLDPEMVAVLQPDGGFVRPERAIAAQAAGALAAGAELHAGERVTGWEPTAEGVRVTTDVDTYEAERLVLTAGAWMRELAGLPVVAERQVLAWLQPERPELFTPDRFPVFVMQTADDERYYGLPQFAVPGFKLGLYHHFEERGPADQLDRTPRPDDEQMLRNYAQRYFPAGAGPAVRMTGCLFENTPDEHFVIGNLPGLPQVIVGGGGSGHGFKFCPVIGEILADLATDGQTSQDIGLFSVDRFQ